MHHWFRPAACLFPVRQHLAGVQEVRLLHIYMDARSRLGHKPETLQFRLITYGRRDADFNQARMERLRRS